MNINQTALNWILGALLALSLACSHLLDGPDEIETARLYQQEIELAPRMAAEEARIERAATQLCVRLNGPGFTHRWSEQGHLHCIASDGLPAQQLGSSI